MKIYRVGLVSYLNSKPFLDGLLRSSVIQQMHLQVLPPAHIAELLCAGELDLGLVPVKVIHRLAHSIINTDYCIGSVGAVYSVCIFSSEPLETCHTLLLDRESRTSVALAKVLLRDYFKLKLEYKPSYFGYETELKNGVAGVVIGDRTFALHKRYPFIYDLGYYWKELTGLPFVFAAWVSTQQIEDTFIKLFNEALNKGISNMSAGLKAFQILYPDILLQDYFKKYISYELNDEKRKALDLFLSKSKEF